MSRLGINGFGRIGRMVLRAAIENCAFVVAINEPNMELDMMVYLFVHDTVYGRFPGRVCAEHGYMMVNGQKIAIFHESNPNNIIWDDAGAAYIIECSPFFSTIAKASGHLSGGAKKVILAAPSVDAPIFACGVNLHTYSKDMTVVAVGSCTFNCLATVVKVMHDNFTVLEGLMTTLHSYTSTQKTIDGINDQLWCEGRGAGHNIIPIPTGSAIAVGRIIPDLKDKLHGIAFRVPIPNVSVVDVTLRLAKSTSYDEIKLKMKEAATYSLKGILAYVDDDIVSSDIKGNTNSAVFDARAGVQLNENFVKIIAWHDNEYGYANRVIDVVKHMQKEDKLW